MRKKLLVILVLTILVASTLVGCGGGGSPCPSTLTILSITEGDVSVMKAGTESWTEAQVEMELKVGDALKTGNSSGAEITFFDGSTIELEASTEIKIISLDMSCDTGSTTIALEQMIGDTISRVTKILDPASSYEVETPSGVAGVRGSGVRIQVFLDDVNYEDGTTLVTNLEGNIYTIAQGVEVEVPEGQQCIMSPGQPPELITFAQIDVVIAQEVLWPIPVFIWDDTTGRWAIDQDTGHAVNGTYPEHVTPATITVAGGHYYYVWVAWPDYIFEVFSCPDDWNVIPDYPYYGVEAAYGLAATNSSIAVSFINLYG